MSWLDGSPKRPSGRSKAKDVPSSSRGVGGWGPSATRTYGSSKRRNAAMYNSSASRGSLGGRSHLAGAHGSASIGLSSMYEEEAGSPAVAGSSAAIFSPTLESSPSELTFSTNRGLELDLDESPVLFIATKPAKKASSKKSGKTSKAKATDAASSAANSAAAGGRTRRANSRTRRAAAGRDASLGRNTRESPEGASGTAVPKRKGTGARKPRAAAARGTAVVAAFPVLDLTGDDESVAADASGVGDGTRLSPKNRRERSPGRRGGGRPERSGERAAGRKSAALPSPLRPVTNNSDDGDRDGRPRPDQPEAEGTVSSVAAAAEEYNEPGSDGSSSSEEEWQDDSDFSKPRRLQGVEQKVAGLGLETTASNKSEAQRNVDIGPGAEIGKADDGLGGAEADGLPAAPLQISPGLALTPSGSTPTASAEPPLSLDSSIEGILVGDKRRRRSSRGKRGARTAEDTAHRSSRSRHLSPMIPVSGAGGGFHAFTVDEEDDCEPDAEIEDLVSHTLDITEDFPTQNDDDEHTADEAEDLLPGGSEPLVVAPAPAVAQAEALSDRQRSFSASTFGGTSAPALSLADSPHLLVKRPLKRAGLTATQRDEALVASSSTLAKASAARELAEWDDGSPPPRLSRSLSLSQTSGPRGWNATGGGGNVGGGSGSRCAKVNRASFRRRSRAYSGSSPMPMPVLEMSSSLDNNHGVAETGAGSVSRSWSQSRGSLFGFGSGSIRPDCGKRRRSMDGLSGRFAGDAAATATARGTGRVSRSHHNLPVGWSAHGGSAAGGQRARPSSLPKGMSLAGIAKSQDHEGLPDASVGGDPGVGWVLRAPAAPFGRHRSQSFAGGRQGFLQTQHSRCASMSSTGGASLPGMLSHGFEGQEEFAAPGGGQKLVLSPGRLVVPPTQTPQASPTQSTSAARHRSNNLSSVARRMDRLEIGSPDVGSQAAQAQKAILESPINEDATFLQTAAFAGGIAAVTTSNSASTPNHPRPVSLPLNLTPNWSMTNPDRLSRGSGGGGSPAECLRDYLSGHRRSEKPPLFAEEDRNRRQQAPTTPSLPAENLASPPGVTCTRTAALGLPTPLVVGLFDRSGESSRHNLPNIVTSSKGSHDDYPDDSFIAKGNISTAGLTEGNDQSVEKALDERGVAAGRNRRGLGGKLARHSTWSPAQPRKGSKLGAEPQSQTLPLGLGDGAVSRPRGLRESVEDEPDEDGNSAGVSSTSSAPPTQAWPSAFSEDNGEDASLPPPTLPKLSAGSRSSSMYLSCLSSGGDIESPSQELGQRVTRRCRSISSPLPLTSTEEPSACDTPSVFHTVGGVAVSGVREDYDGGDGNNAVDESTRDRGHDPDEQASAGLGVSNFAHRHDTRSPEIGGMSAVLAAPGLSLGEATNPRRTSTESAGAEMGISSRAQFETPQPEAKLKWGSRPQYGDWGISQPASAGSLRRLAGQLMAFAGRATGGRFSGASSDSEPLMADASPGALSQAATPQRSCSSDALLSFDENLRLPLKNCPGSSSSTASSHRDRSSFGMGFRRSLGTLSERGEAGAGGGGDVAGTGEIEEGDVGVEVDGGIEREGGRVQEQAVGREDYSNAIEFRDESWDAAESDAQERGRSRLSGVMMTDAQRDAQRRRQSKAKMRRVSMSIKSRQSSAATSTRGSGLSLIGIAEADSPGHVGNPNVALAIEKQRRRRTSFGVGRSGKEQEKGHRQTVGFGRGQGGVIFEGDEQDVDDDLEVAPRVAPETTTPSARWAPSPMSLERREWTRDEGLNLFNKPAEEAGKGDTPAKVREDLEKSLTELHNLSISLCNSEGDESPTKQRTHALSKEFLLSPSLDDDLEGVAVTAGLEYDQKSTAEAKVLEALTRPGVMAKALSMLSVEELLGESPVVCRAWRKAASLAFAEVASRVEERVHRAVRSVLSPGARQDTADATMACGGSRSEWAPEKLVATFPWGGFLSEGSFKKVYKVWNAVQARMEALSVMDRHVIAESGNEEVISQELRVSILASSLVQRGVCPNFVQTFGLFRSECSPPSDVFGTSDERYPCGRSPGIIRSQPWGFVPQTRLRESSRARSDSQLRYQFIGMELCGHGDAEDLIRDQPDALLPLAEAHGFLFQMAFALYAARAELSMRHFDVKLLNFFVGDASQLVKLCGNRDSCRAVRWSNKIGPDDRTEGGQVGIKETGGSDDDNFLLRYGIGQDVVELRMPQDRAFVVKLADFGTADVDPSTVGEAVGVGQFTTLENTPIEQLCCGSDAQQCYASDTFALALAAVHLFTGGGPYEEVMEEVECPDGLYDILANTWSDHRQFDVVRNIVLDVGDGDEDGDEDEQDATLMHTFYRYLVLFGVPERSVLEEAFGADNPVWNAVGALLGWKSRKGRRRKAGGLSLASKQFSRQLHLDQARFSLKDGTHPLIARGRVRLNALPGAMDLVMSMASFCPEQRPSMLEALSHPAFETFRMGGGDGRVRDSRDRVLEFMTFARCDDHEQPLLDL